MRGASGLCETPPRRLAESVRLAFERQTGSGDRITHPLAEAINRERLSVFCIDDRDVFPFGGGEDGQQVLMKRDRQFAPSFLLDDANAIAINVRPCFGARLTGARRYEVGARTQVAVFVPIGQ